MAALLMLSGCTNAGSENLKIQQDTEAVQMSYTRISAEKAMEIMESGEEYIIADVRRQDEYTEGHIPGAVCIPNETIGTEMPSQLPDKEKLILIYCRSGNRSRQAARKLCDMGYSNIYEFGGIIDWTGEIVKDEE